MCWEFNDLDGNRVKRSPISFPYSYDPYVTYIDCNFDKEKCKTVYSDRMMSWNYDKFNDCCRSVFGNVGQMFSNRSPRGIETFLCLYFEKSVKLRAIMQGCNVSNGYPYWIFYYEEV